MTNTVQTAVVGVTGYAGAELAGCCCGIPVSKACRRYLPGAWMKRMRRSGGIPLSEIHPQLADCNGSGALKLEPFSWELLARRGRERSVSCHTA